MTALAPDSTAAEVFRGIARQVAAQVSIANAHNVGVVIE